MLKVLDPYRWLIGAVLLAALVGGCLWGWHSITTRYDRQGYERAKAEDRAEADKQAERNRELQRAAEKRYVVQEGVRDRYLVTTVREVHEAAAPLADCPVPSDVRVRIRAAVACARDNTTASCGSDEPVPDSR